MEEKNKYAVYSHSYNDVIFYIGSGRIYEEEEGQTSRPYNFSNRNKKWKAFCKGEIDKIKVEILFETNDQKESLAIEEHITGMYIDRAPLVNKNLGIHPSAKTRKKMSLAKKGENNPWYGKRGKGTPMYGKKQTLETRKRLSEAQKGEKSSVAKKVKITNTLTNEPKVFDSITGAYKFISQNGFDKTQMTLHNYLNKGPFQFNNYNMEIIKEFN